MANNLNVFFSRFGEEIKIDTECEQLDLTATATQYITITQAEVCTLFKGVNTHKSPGTDHMCGNMLKHCFEQLSPVFTDMFQSSLDQHCSIIMENLPKISPPAEQNHYCPIALTSLVMKCFGKIVKKRFSYTSTTC